MEIERLQQQMSDWSELLTRTQLAFQKSGRLAADKATGDEFSLVDFSSVLSAYLSELPKLLSDPVRMTQCVQTYWLDWAKAWTPAWQDGQPGTKDKRFRDERWDSDPALKGLKESHIALEKATAQFLSGLPEDSREALRVKFYTRQMLSAMSPANHLLLNPTARDKLIESEGQSILDGFRNFVEDLERGDGRLDIATNDAQAFVVGQDLAATPGKVIFENELMQLIHYAPLTETQKKRPLIFVPPWINKFYIFDMRPHNSMVRYMLEQGHSVFLISWVNPTKEHAHLSFEDYMKLGPLAALDVAQKATGEKKFDILGFCIGGILVTATLAYLAAKKDRRIVTATTLATMVDFEDVGETGVFIDNDQLASMRKHMKETGYLEASHLRDMFSMMRENDLIWSFHVMNYLMGNKPPAFDLLYWNADSTRLPAAMLLWYLEHVYLENGLRKPGHLVLDGVPIDISKINIPMFVLATKEDHIALWKSIYPATQLLAGDVTFVLGGSGHIAGVINPPASKPKYGYWTNEDYPADHEQWFSGAEQHEGSWWPAWTEWITDHTSEKEVPARIPGEGGMPAIEDAPGRYVLAK